MDDRLDVNSLYGGSVNKGQSGGVKTKKTKKYTPLDDDSETSSSISKLFKANRLLQKELNELKEQLQSELLKNSKLEKLIQANNLQLI